MSVPYDPQRPDSGHDLTSPEGQSSADSQPPSDATPQNPYELPANAQSDGSAGAQQGVEPNNEHSAQDPAPSDAAYGYSAAPQESGHHQIPDQQSAPQSPYGAQAPSGTSAGTPYGAGSGYSAPSASDAGVPPQGGYSAPGGYSAQPGYGPQSGSTAGAGAGAGTGFSQQGPVNGVYDGPLTGAPVAESEERTWGMLAHLAAVLSNVISAGYVGFIGPLVIYFVYRDRSRFIRFHASEALHGAIYSTVVVWILTFLTILLSFVLIGFLFLPLIYVVPLYYLVVGIIGAVKANNGQWWNYPLTPRLFR